METGLKHPRLTRFLELAAKVGWKQSDVARALKRSRGQISKIYNEKLPPSESLVSLLEHEVNAVLKEQNRIEEINAKTVGIPPATVDDKLSFLKQHDPAGYRVATNTIDTLHQRAVDEVILHEKSKPKPASSAEVSQAAADANASASKIESGEQSGTSQHAGAASPPARKAQPGAASSQRAKARHTVREGKGRK